ncbi:uracil-DNA glycosylase family protein [Paraburkholderia sp.]|uniref:uracil-DNA glycosylase n=1 Tax=Paraburkholderia sp. TaxID=1926495 RepID=UPI0039E6EC84
MALHESVLEEFGLAPLWVRRGMAAGEAAAEAGAAQDAAASTQADAVSQSAQEGPRSAPRAEPAPQAAGEPTRASADIRQPQAQRNSAPPYEDAAPRQQATQQRPPLPEPPHFDAPPDDDFAWFDDAAASAPTPTEAHRDAPALPAIHTLDWDALAARVATCQSCRLCERRTNTVFGVGDRNADWMLVGEAPGENEDRQGEPFVGQAGKLLDNMLRSLALARGTNVYIANVIKCRPPGNRNPQPDEVARCEPYLQRQVSLVKPKLIVALGRFAAQSLLKTEASISSLRGRVHKYEGVPVIVTYHPAYLLRSLPDKSKAWADLCLARDTWLAGGGAPSNESK